jgi:hypothetical protein
MYMEIWSEMFDFARAEMKKDFADTIYSRVP